MIRGWIIPRFEGLRLHFRFNQVSKPFSAKRLRPTLTFRTAVQVRILKQLARNIFVFIAVIAMPFITIATENIQIQSAVEFNTECARCHEGECTGRMTFRLPPTAAYQHIRRHGGDLSEEKIHQLLSQGQIPSIHLQQYNIHAP